LFSSIGSLLFYRVKYAQKVVVMTYNRVAFVNAFTHEPYTGNPAAVCLLSHLPDASRMQKIASELGASVTAFIAPERAGYQIRWFTPSVQSAFCGHATLASAHTLIESGVQSAEQPILFYSERGELGARRAADGAGITLNFPALPAESIACPAELLAELQTPPVRTVRTELDLIIELPSVEAVKAVQPNFPLIATLPFRGVAVTAHSDGRPYDIVSRFFAPRLGHDEDFATGSLHCALAPLWGARFGKRIIHALQASARPGELHLELQGDRVLITGGAVTIARGELLHA